SWLEQYIADSVQKSTTLSGELSSKYATSYSKIAQAPVKNIKAPTVKVLQDTSFRGRRKIKLHLSPNRKIDRLADRTTATKISRCTVNGIPVPLSYLFKRSDRLFTHYISENQSTDIELECSQQDQLSFQIYEVSYDLLNHSLFSVPDRPKNTIAMPFVLNDAVLTKKTLKL